MAYLRAGARDTEEMQRKEVETRHIRETEVTGLLAEVMKGMLGGGARHERVSGG